MYKTKIGCICCVLLFFLLAGCGKGTPTDLTGTPDALEESEVSEKTEEPEHQVEMELVEYTYPFYELWCAANAEPNYVTTDDGACRVVFSAKYSKLIFALPEGINMALCDHVTVKARSEYGRFGVDLYDEVVYINPWDMHVYAAYDFGGEGVQDYILWPEATCDVWGVGIISVDEVEDFSKYVVDVYSVTFHMKEEK